MQKLKHFDANFVTKTFFPGVKPERINSGLCCNWAFYTYLLFTNVKLCSFISMERAEGDNYPCHAYVKWNGKVYDAEVPDGVDSFGMLPCFKRCQRLVENNINDVYIESIEYNEQCFQNDWSINRVNWIHIEYMVMTYMHKLLEF